MKVILLDGDYSHSLPVAEELVNDLGANIIAAVSGKRSHLARSRFVSRTFIAPPPDSPGYATRIANAARMVGPSVIVPLGYPSFRSMIEARDSLPSTASLVAPSAQAFDIAASKVETSKLAQHCGVRVPEQVGRVESGIVTSYPSVYPVFAKSTLERGGTSTALVRSEAELREFEWSTLGGDAVLQEVIDGDAYTYGVCGYFERGRAVVTMQHIETLSVPRRGGSATRIRTFEDTELGAAAESLMQQLGWTGAAQIEFKRARDGDWVLMEINPKFWASYAHTSRAGGRIASTAVARAAGRQEPLERGSPSGNVEMVFPFRELQHMVRSRSIPECLRGAAHIVWPPARPNFQLRDLPANIPIPRRRPR